MNQLGVFVGRGVEILNDDPKAKEDSRVLNCDTCGKDVWFRSFKVGVGTDANNYCAQSLVRMDAEIRIGAKKHAFDEEVGQ